MEHCISAYYEIRRNQLPSTNARHNHAADARMRRLYPRNGYYRYDAAAAEGIREPSRIFLPDIGYHRSILPQDGPSHPSWR
eukprot:scaffold666359_cov48-Prasinocladus_malaysianus.AAC.1